MKKLIALLLALAMPLCFAACGDEGSSEGGDSGAPAEITGTTTDAGNFTVLVPEGWKAFPVVDIWSEENANDPDQLNIVKGGQTDFDLLSKPYIQIVHYGPETDLLTPSKDFYDMAADVASFTTGTLTWQGFSAEGMLGSSLILLWTGEAGAHQYQINVYDKTDAGQITLTDADVQAILASITAK